jgi:hypothetical protein
VKATVPVIILVSLGLFPTYSFAAPSAETAKRCMRYSYIVYPYTRPGATRMSGDRQAYFRDCLAKDGFVSDPTPAK